MKRENSGSLAGAAGKDGVEELPMSNARLVAPIAGRKSDRERSAHPDTRGQHRESGHEPSVDAGLQTL
jgi:hypothetical protein